MNSRFAVFFLAVALALAACASQPTASSPAVSATLEGDVARPAQAQGWARSELYFGTGAEGSVEGAISEDRWRSFLDREVTPRFPDGLTVLDAYGQWLSRGEAQPSRLTSKVLVILHEDTPERASDIQAIRSAWKAETGHQSVLWSKQSAQVSF
jgi:hypothetical protein